MIQKDRRYVVEQYLLPDELYTSGPMLLLRAMGDVNSVMERFYIEADAEYPGAVFDEAHRVYYRDDASVLIIRIGMPAPKGALLSRAVYLCYSSKNSENLYFTSELAETGQFFLCCKPDSEKIMHMLCGDAPDDAAKEYDMVADCYWELVINDGLKQLESICTC